MSTNRSEHTVLLSVDYHGQDEVIDRQEVTMTRNELRAVMVWMSRLTINGLPSENCVMGVNKIFRLLQKSNNSVTETKRQLGGPQNAEEQDP